MFDPRRVPTLNCNITSRGQGSTELKCVNESDCVVDLGIQCQKNTLLKEILVGECSTTALTTTQEPTCTEETNTCSTLGGVVGVLVTVLVVLVIGWSLSCVALVKRNSHTQKQQE